MVIARRLVGHYRRLKDRIALLLFGFYLLAPFIKISGRPLFHFDIPNRKFTFFTLTIWPQEFYLLLVLLLIMGLMLFLATAIWGRVWCGYGCPQTLITDIFDFVGRLAAGDKYGKNSVTFFQKIRIWFAWVFLSVFLSGIFVSYFVTPEVMINSIYHGQIFAHRDGFEPSAFIKFWAGGTAAMLIIWGWFRENVCRYVCPYGRFQTALLDDHSPIVSYDKKRGEPRRQKGETKHVGDCTACNLCNLVCPTGIDIREGLQVGCISCAQCIDACTHEMKRTGKPTLISFKTIKQENEPGARREYFYPRSVIYIALLSIIVGAFITLLIKRIPIYANVLRDKIIYNMCMDNKICQNGYEIHIGNLSYEAFEAKIEIQTSNLEKPEILGLDQKVIVKPGESESKRIIVKAIKPDHSRGSRIRFLVSNPAKPEQIKVIESFFSFPQ